MSVLGTAKPAADQSASFYVISPRPIIYQWMVRAHHIWHHFTGKALPARQGLAGSNYVS